VNNIAKISLWVVLTVILTVAAALRRAARDNQKGQTFRKIIGSDRLQSPLAAL
jgi:hypothetical protein